MISYYANNLVPCCANDLELQISFLHSTYQDVYVPEEILKELCTEAGVNFANEKAICVPLNAYYCFMNDMFIVAVGYSFFP